ncbi:MAG: hypothetical protein ABIO19_05970 [Burkholderiaceae bacterium]
MTFWNQQFASKDFKYGKQPNSFLREQAFRLRPGSKVLLPGDGEALLDEGSGHQGLAYLTCYVAQRMPV